MSRKIYLKILLGVVAFIALVKISSIVFVEPWIGKKIQASLNEKNQDFTVEIDKVHLLMLSRSIELERITLRPKQESGGSLTGEIASLKFKGIKLVKAFFKKEVEIRAVIISNSSIRGKIPFSQKAVPSIVSPLTIRIASIFFDKINLAIQDSSTAQVYSLKESDLKVYDLQVKKNDTLTAVILQQFDFDAEEFFSISSDSMYMVKASGIVYSAALNTLTLANLSVQPNYTNYDFTSRYKFQTDRIEVFLSDIHAQNISAADYLKFKNIASSFIEIGKMEVHVFRDKRKEFKHVNKPAFQEMIYSYPATIRIDSVGVVNGNVTYTEHAEDANEPGSIHFDEIHAKVYKITNDTIYKTENAFLELKGEALLMGKGKMTTALKAQLFDTRNKFSLSGTLAGMEAKALNPMLEKNAYVYATSGTIDAMDFSITANNARATGNMHMRYHGLDLAIKSKKTDDTTAIKERFISFIANRKVMDANPLPGEEVREGVIEYERDPEKFLFNYCFKAILSGIKSSIEKSPKEKRSS